MIAAGEPRRQALCDHGPSAAAGHHDAAALQLVMQGNDRRLLRAAWRILGNREDAEDAVQSAYLSAITAIGGFAGRSTLATWLTRIVINAALAQARRRRRRRAWLEEDPTALLEDYSACLMRGSMSGSPERAFACRQLKHFIDDAIDQLPTQFRTVFILRQIEERDVGEVAQTLGINAATVKTRHLRARRRLQRALAPKVGNTLADMFLFADEAREPVGRRSSPAPIHGEWRKARGSTA
ncbi:sigma-70 family RNA polymerase sigma factor [Novosphingobium album (ex Liu et al. 2023)]|uniref:Sigma-70 family RNA polymerase sigma factor n=1 Tax=Novosphingobium album (ex Liu et al. 2023) TaxID=3031130 RepID=A0ABT5WTD2_9SPHN|nr:sigma-70 family RNA polymerase sigma factor [Novosphingobium album (ex Liu et al. 2023)]MDE8652798.1 sigma-70 family RNA polymerase sigma factor [Novosphingobium album (ex Liu et al. 2023)]